MTKTKRPVLSFQVACHRVHLQLPSSSGDRHHDLVPLPVRQVVVVYEYGKRRLQVKARLCGHTEAVLSLAASTAYSLIVSG